VSISNKNNFKFFFNFCINRKINSIFLKQILKKNEKQGHELLDQTHK
jgi:hypothetical protein